MGLGGGGSPLAGHARNVEPGEPRADGIHAEDAAQDAAGNAGQKGLDVDSTQIVNLALNLSESRRQAARRVVTSPLPPTIPGFEENFAGGSLRQHLQGQRRSSRNISPKPDRGERSFSAAAKGLQSERLSSPLQTAFNQDGEYQYQFSAATLDRAEKARNAIELMAQYRRLLQYLPPLKPQGLSRTTTASPPSTSAGSPIFPIHSFPLSHPSTTTNRSLGRAYNPLQYIRNRKVRARERQPIDGEVQGFGNVENVTSWVDRVAKEARIERYEASDCVELPPLVAVDGEPGSPNAPAEANSIKPAMPPVKVKRPRVDWMINAPDMLADIVWLEQHDNKKFIEDNRERKIFPPSMNLIRTQTARSEEQQQQRQPSLQPEVTPEKRESLHVDTKLPVFKSLRPSDHRPDMNRVSKLRHKLRKVAHELDNAEQDAHILRDDRSDLDTSGSEDAFYASKRKRSGTADSYDYDHDILEKQMMDMLAKEAREKAQDVSQKPETESVLPSIEKTISPVGAEKEPQMAATPAPQDQPSKSKAKKHRGSPSVNIDDNRPPSGRTSLEVPGHRPRQSLGSDLDTTAPNSPESKASKLLNALIPSISMDLSPPPSRRDSPVRKPALQRVRSKISHLRDRSVEPAKKEENGNIDGDIDSKGLERIPTSPPEKVRSPSPKRKPRRATEYTIKPPTISALVPSRPKDDSSYGARVFKSRNPIARVSDLIWRKEGSPVSEKPEESPSESDSDFESSKEDLPPGRETADVPLSKQRSFLDEMPTFTSPFEGRGRSTRAKSPRPLAPEQQPTQAQQDQEEDRESQLQRQQALDRLKPPRIDIQRPPGDTVPEVPPADTRRPSRTSDVTDLASRTSSLSRVQTADVRLNEILGMPGVSPMMKDFLPVTGLALLDGRRKSAVGERRWSVGAEPAAAEWEGDRVTRREVARVRALLLSSGVKAKEITRRANELRDFNDAQGRFADVAEMARERENVAPAPVARAQEHRLAARVLEQDIGLSTRVWRASAQHFTDATVPALLRRIEGLKMHIEGPEGLMRLGTTAADEADELSREVMSSQMLKTKALGEAIDTLMRRRRRRFRWLRRAGWMVVEWALVGVMWWVWLVVVLLRVGMGVAKGVLRGVRWLLWL